MIIQRKFLRVVVVSVVFAMSAVTARAVTVDFVGISNAFGTLSIQSQANERFNPLGATFQILTGANLQVENTDLTVQGGSYLVNFDHAVSSVRLQVTNNKDAALITFSAFDAELPFPFSINFGTSGALAITTLQISPLFPGVRQVFDLTLTNPLIRSVLVTSNKFLWATHEIEFEAASAIPVPAALPLFLSGLLGLGVMARRRKQKVV